MVVHASDSDEHKALRERITRAANAAGFPVAVHRPAPPGRRRADVLVYGHDVLLGCRPVISPVSVDTVHRHSAAAVGEGVTPLWATTDRRAAVVDRAPWARIDRLPWHHYLQPHTELPVRGGVRRLRTVRCAPGTVCQDARLGRPCSGWNNHWEPHQVPRFDDLIARAAAAELRPVRQRVDGDRSYWFWAPAADLAQVRPAPSSTPLVTELGRVTLRLDTPFTPVHLDWSDPRHLLEESRPCRICGRLAMLADDRGRPCHKVCAERERNG
jgi:hypothetical protein